MDRTSEAQKATGQQREVATPKGDGAIPPFFAEASDVLSHERSLILRWLSRVRRRLHL